MFLLPAVAAASGGCGGGEPKPAARDESPTIRLAGESVEWSNLPPEVMGLAKTWPQGVFAEVFPVRTSAGEFDALPSIVGAYSMADGCVRFTPRFAFTPGLTYRVGFILASREGKSSAGNRIVELTPAAAPAGPATYVTAVYPSADTLPENQLKLYIHFSAPMSRGDAYSRVRLIDHTAGKDIDLPFLELDQELWDPTMTRFTLFFDPGRIKRGLKPREEFGPALEEGHSYTFVVDAAWEDANGRPLREAFKKSFRVGPPDDTQPDPKTWKIAPPAAGSREPVTIDFPKPMDRAMMLRVIGVTGPGGAVAVAGRTELNEMRLLLTPVAAWPAGRYELVVDTALEDLSGNSIRKPFEVDLFRSIERQTEVETVKIPFEVR